MTLTLSRDLGRLKIKLRPDLSYESIISLKKLLDLVNAANFIAPKSLVFYKVYESHLVYPMYRNEEIVLSALKAFLTIVQQGMNNADVDRKSTRLNSSH